MSFLHWDVVAVVDPRDSTERGPNGFNRPKAIRPISAEEVAWVFGAASANTRDVLELHENGCLWCCWSANLKDEDEIHRLARELADRVGGAVMCGIGQILHPPAAVAIQAEAQREYARQHESESARC